MKIKLSLAGFGLSGLGFAFVLAAAPALAAPEGDHPGAPISFDGSMDDWPAGLEATAGGHWIYFRYDTQEPTSLQNGTVMTVLQLDLDGDSRTGAPSGQGDLGIDFEIAITTLDQRDPNNLGGGIEIIAFGEDGMHESLTHSDIGFSFLPTYASASFEIRILREFQGPAWLGKMARASGQINYRFIHRDELYETKWTGAARSVSLPEMTPGPELFDVNIPSRAAGDLRVVSWNVLWGSPSVKPEGFARVLRVLNPDVILFQEWDKGYWTKEDRITERDYVDWLNTHLGAGPWSVERGAERGVLIASRSSLSPFLPDQIEVQRDRKAGILRSRIVRCASARVATPLGEVGAVSIHLKSRGGLDSSEDMIRLAETSAVHAAIEGAMSAKKPDFLVIAGDWNLVGGRGPLDRVADGSDMAGTDLLVVEPRRLGADDVITWRDQRSHFSPGRLDYALIADDGVELVRSFILDTSALTDSALRRAGLERRDNEGSDHLPIVLDLRRKASD